MPRVYVARERGATDIPIDAVFREGRFDILPSVLGRGFFDIKFKRDRLTITAGKFVGLIPLNDDVIVQVEPKIPVKNLLTIVSADSDGIVEMPALQQSYEIAPTAPPSILEVIAQAFLLALRRAEVLGFTRTYERSTDSGGSLKGYIEFQDSIQKYWGRGSQHAAVCSSFDLTGDGWENQLLRYACWQLLAQHRSTGAFAKSIQELAYFDEALAGIGVRIQRPETSRRALFMNVEPVYRRALELAELISLSQGVDLPGGGSEVALSSFLIDMETVFETYVRRVLLRLLPGYSVEDGNRTGARPLYDDRAVPPANPDIVIRKGAKTLIGEVKYKALETREDIGQGLTYGLCYRSPIVVLILPAEHPEEGGLVEVGNVASIRVLRYRFNLAAVDLAAEEREFASTVGGLLS